MQPYIYSFPSLIPTAKHSLQHLQYLEHRHRFPVLHVSQPSAKLVANPEADNKLPVAESQLREVALAITDRRVSSNKQQDKQIASEDRDFTIDSDRLDQREDSSQFAKLRGFARDDKRDQR